MTASTNFQAALLALTSTAILSLVDNFVEPVSREAGLWQFHVFRTLFAIPVLLVFAKVSGATWRPMDMKPVALRSALVAIGLFIYFGTLAVLPVAQAGAGVFTAPIWVMLFSALLFKTRVSALQAIAIPSGFIGALILLQIDPANLTTLSVLPVAAGAFYGLGMLMTRHRCAEESAVALSMGVFVMIGVAAAVLLIVFTLWPAGGETPGFAARGWVTPSPRFLALTAVQGFGAVIAVTLIAQAYRIGLPAYVAVFEYSFLIFASMWAFLLRGDTVGSGALVGIAIIIASGAMLSLFSPKAKPDQAVS